jgi:hypothetical protein
LSIKINQLPSDDDFLIPLDTNGKRPLSLGRIHDPVHPIMAGVENLDGGRSSFFCPGALNSEARLVSEWSNGVPLAVELQKTKGTVVGVNLFPPSSDTGDPRFWHAASDGAVLLANALAYAGRSSVLRKRRLPRSPLAVLDSQGNWVYRDVNLMDKEKDFLRGKEKERNREEKGKEKDVTNSPESKKRRPFYSAKLFGKRLFARWLLKKPE